MKMLRNLVWVLATAVFLVGCNPKKTQSLGDNRIAGDLPSEKKTTLSKLFAPIYFSEQAVDRILNNGSFYSDPEIPSEIANAAAEVIHNDRFGSWDRDPRCAVENGDAVSFLSRQIGIEYAGNRRIYSLSGESAHNDVDPEEKCPIKLDMETSYQQGHVGGSQAHMTQLRRFRLETRGQLANGHLVRSLELTGTGQAVIHNTSGSPVQSVTERYVGSAVVKEVGTVSILREIQREVRWQGGLMSIQTSRSSWEITSADQTTRIDIISERNIRGGQGISVYVDGQPTALSLFSHMVTAWDRGVDPGSVDQRTQK